MVQIFGPAVDREMIVSDFAGFISNADGTGVAHPAAISWYAEEIHGIKIYSGLFQDGSNAGFGGAVFDEKIDAFHLRQMTDDLGKRPRDGRKFSGPDRYLVLPAEPGGFMAFPFGQHLQTHNVQRF